MGKGLVAALAVTLLLGLGPAVALAENAGALEVVSAPEASAPSEAGDIVPLDFNLDDEGLVIIQDTQAKTFIDNVSLTLVAPKSGDVSSNIAASSLVKVPTGAHYEVEWRGWATADGQEYDKDITFEAGKTYYVNVTLKAKDGYAFNAQNGAGTYAGTITLSGARVEKNSNEAYTSDTYSGLAIYKIAFDVASSSADISKAKITGVEDATYTGKAIKPTPVVTYNGKQLTKGRDYTVSYKNNTNASTSKTQASVTITGVAKAGYTGTKTVTFTINKAASSIQMKKKQQNKTYTGKAIKYTGGITTTGSTGEVTYTYYKDSKCTKKTTIKNVGTYYVKATLAADSNYKAATSAKATIVVKKASNTIKIASKTKSFAYKNGNKTRTIKLKTELGVKSAQGSVTFIGFEGNKKIALSKGGVLTIKKGLKKGTYKCKFKIKANGNKNYSPKTQECSVTINIAK